MSHKISSVLLRLQLRCHGNVSCKQLRKIVKTYENLKFLNNENIIIIISGLSEIIASRPLKVDWLISNQISKIIIMITMIIVIVFSS